MSKTIRLAFKTQPQVSQTDLKKDNMSNFWLKCHFKDPTWFTDCLCGSATVRTQCPTRRLACLQRVKNLFLAPSDIHFKVFLDLLNT